MAYFTITIQMEEGLHPTGEPDDFITEYTGSIRLYNERKGRVWKVGKLRAYRINIGLALDRREHLFDVCDCHSQQLTEISEALFDPNEGFYKESIADRFGITASDCLVLDYVVVNPRVRGLRLGLLALLRAVEMLRHGCGLTVCDPSPLSEHAPSLLKIPSSWVPLNATPEQSDAAKEKLAAYIERLGFHQIEGTGYYGLADGAVTPSVEQLLKPHI
jgi:hypothetical protein